MLGLQGYAGQVFSALGVMHATWWTAFTFLALCLSLRLCCSTTASATSMAETPPTALAHVLICSALLLFCMQGSRGCVHALGLH